MKTKLLILLLLLLAPANKLLTQEISECKCSPQYWVEDGDNLYNSDNRIVLDTCEIKYYSANCDSVYWLNYDNYDFSYIYFRLYARYYWDIWLDVDAIPIPKAPQDTTILVSWEAIDTNYSEIRSFFHHLDTTEGSFLLYKAYPESPPGTEASRVFWLYFIDSSYHHIESITKYIDEIENTSCWFGSPLPSKSKTDFLDNISQSENVLISPNPASEYIEISVGARHAVTVRNVQIQIFDVYGKSVISVETSLRPVSTQRINVSHLPVGIYFVRVGSDVKSFVVLR